MRRLAAIGAFVAAIVVAAGAARAQTVTLRTDSRDLYAGLPFVLSVQAEGFDESPEPAAPEVSIPGANVTYLGMSPNVSTMVSVANGRRIERREVTFVYRYRIETPTAGSYTVPALTVEQGARRATSRPASFRTVDIEASADMRLRVVVPDRPIWVGETFDVVVEWYLRRDVQDRSFVVPLFDAEGKLEIEAPARTGRNALPFAAGARELQLPFERDQATLDGVEYTRFRFTARATALQPGVLELPPARVVAQLKVGEGRDAFGFRVPQVRLFKAEDRPLRIDVRALPLAGRPAGFANAVGSDFSIDVQADRTVVRVGDPIELRITVRGGGRLSGLILPDLGADGGLPPAQFSVPDEAPPGELLDEGKAKLFRVAVRLKNTDAREIPPLAFSYFDPEAGEYRTVRSQPIALQVGGSATVGAGDVVRGSGAPAAAAGGAASPVSLVGADLTLSADRRTLAAAPSIGAVRPWVIALYVVPVVVLLVQLWRVRTRGRRQVDSGRRRALGDVLEEVDAASSAPARDAGPRIARALRRLARQIGKDPEETFLERLETEAFRPGAADHPLSADLRDEARARAHRMVDSGRADSASAGTAAALCLAFLAAAGPARAQSAGSASPVRAPGDTATKLAAARDAYRQALSESDRDRRTVGFAGAEALYRELALAHPDRPELLTDWGNAALGAQELGQATLAYRRALQLQPGLERARRNLAWVRKQAPDWLPRPAGAGAVESLFFWHQALSPAERHLLGAAGFCAALLLLAPFAADPRRRRTLRRIAVVPALVWIGMLGSLALQRDRSEDAVITGDAVILRAADSPGAPATLAHPLPAGTEVVVDEVREGWIRVRLADGAAGWAQAASVELVTPR